MLVKCVVVLFLKRGFSAIRVVESFIDLKFFSGTAIIAMNAKRQYVLNVLIGLGNTICLRKKHISA